MTGPRLASALLAGGLPSALLAGGLPRGSAVIFQNRVPVQLTRGSENFEIDLYLYLYKAEMFASTPEREKDRRNWSTDTRRRRVVDQVPMTGL